MIDFMICSIILYYNSFSKNIKNKRIQVKINKKVLKSFQTRVNKI